MSKCGIPRLFGNFAAVALLASGLASCEKADPGPVPGTTPIDELIQSGRSPVETGSMVRGISPIMPVFKMSVKNVSDVPISLINGTVLFFDGEGKVLADTVQEAGYTDLSPIEPGGSIELQIMTGDERAVTGQYILKEAIYEKTNPKFPEYGGISMKWENAGHDAAVAAAKGG